MDTGAGVEGVEGCNRSGLASLNIEDSDGTVGENAVNTDTCAASFRV